MDTPQLNGEEAKEELGRSLKESGKKRRVTASQVSPAWVLAQREDFIPMVPPDFRHVQYQNQHVENGAYLQQIFYQSNEVLGTPWGASHARPIPPSRFN